MMFKFTALFSALLATASFVSAAPAATQKTSSPVINIVYNPVITYPTAGVVWTVGENKTITWEVDEIPAELLNSTGTILIGYNEDDSENLDIAHPLATGFNLKDGKVNVTVPEESERNDYIVVLFGDSGNASPEFTIKPSSSSSVLSSATASESSTLASATSTVASITSTLAPASSTVDSLASSVASPSATDASDLRF